MKRKCGLKQPARFLLRRMPNRSAEVLRLNGLCPYYTMFPLDFPSRKLSKAKPSDWVLDPFCGRRTANFVARLRGLPSLGIESNPVAVAIANAKFVDVNTSGISSESKTILTEEYEPEDVPEERFWDLHAVLER